MVAEEINIIMVLVVLVGMEMVLMVILLLEAKALPMVHKAVQGIHLVMVLMADLAVAVDPISRIRPQIPAVRQEKMKVMVRLSLLIVQVSALQLHP